MKKKTKLLAVGLALVLLFALSNCDNLVPLGEDEYTDVMYEFDATGSFPKKITLYLDGVGIPKSESGAPRALTADRAKFAFDTLEAVFVNGIDTTLASTVVTRAQWRIGQSASVGGLARSVNYGATIPTTGVGSSILFVGMDDGTLLGIGALTATSDAGVGGVDASCLIGPDTKAVTFTVVPLFTQIGLRSTYTAEGDPVISADTNFYTNAGNASATAAPALGDTAASWAEYRGNRFPLFSATTRAAGTTRASYRLFGQTEGGTIIPDLGAVASLNVAGANGRDATNLLQSIRPNGTPVVDAKMPTFFAQGQTYIFSSGSYVTKPTIWMRADAGAAHAANVGTDPTAAAGSTFAHPIPFWIIIPSAGENAGLFMFSFSIPVKALTMANPANAVAAKQWYIKTAIGDNAYYLDDGMGWGGAILMGAGATSADLIRIFYNGIGQNY